jgi:hypothetical protein
VSLHKTQTAVIEAVVASVQSTASGEGPGGPRGIKATAAAAAAATAGSRMLSQEMASEAMAAAALVDVMLQLFPQASDSTRVGERTGLVFKRKSCFQKLNQRG